MKTTLTASAISVTTFSKAKNRFSRFICQIATAATISISLSVFLPVAAQAVISTLPSVNAGGDHSYGLTTGGEAYCWGYNCIGELGDGTNTVSNVPVLVHLEFDSPAPVYRLTDLGTLGGGYTEGRALNNAGQVTGMSFDYSYWSHAFFVMTQQKRRTVDEYQE